VPSLLKGHMLEAGVEDSASDTEASDDLSAERDNKQLTIARRRREKGSHGGGRDLGLFYVPLPVVVTDWSRLTNRVYLPWRPVLDTLS
jgi:hypothetical protein